MNQFQLFLVHNIPRKLDTPGSYKYAYQKLTKVPLQYCEKWTSFQYDSTVFKI